MQAMHCHKILAFVEGTMEKVFVNTNFKHVHLIPVSNGRSWTIERIAERIASNYHTVNLNPDLIIVWIDLEVLSRDVDKFKEVILDQLSKRGADLNKIHFLIPNRMTENMILADELIIRETFDDASYCYQHEGKGGKSILSQLYKNNGETYKPTNQGIKLLSRIRIERSAMTSPSVNDFFQNIAIPCWWLQAQN